jgi:hypothetical protein
MHQRSDGRTIAYVLELERRAGYEPEDSECRDADCPEWGEEIWRHFHLVEQ